MRRTLGFSRLVLGLLLFGLLGSSLVARVSDTVRSDGNQMQSGTFTPPAHNVQAAKVHFSTGDCATATYAEGPLTSLFGSDGGGIAIQNEGSGRGALEDICVKNAGTSAGRLTVSFLNAVQSELAPCSAGEASAGDTDCASTTGIGELGRLFTTSFSADAGSAASCVGASQAMDTWLAGAPVVVDVNLAPGEICRFGLSFVNTAGRTETERLLAQSDKIQWDIVFTLEDAP